MSSLVFQSKTIHPLRIYMVGHQPKRFDWPEAKGDLVAILGEDPGDALLAVPAPTANDSGYGLVRQALFNSALRTDGILYRGSGPAIIMTQSADCPFTVVQDEETGDVVVAHCGKYAMRPCTERGCGNMVTTALSYFPGVDPIRLSAYITAGICGRCYTHEQDLSHTVPFYNRVDHGEDRERGELDLIRRIKHQLRFADIPEANIEIDGRCTKETPGLSSNRRGDTSRSTIIVQIG